MANVADSTIGKNVFITGISGCVGHAVVRALTGRGFRISGLVRPGHALSDYLRTHPDVTFVEGDLQSLVAGQIPQDAWIIHLAAMVHVRPLGEDQVKAMYATNQAATIRLGEMALERQARGFVFISSSVVYASAQSRPGCDESLDPQPSTPYAKSKLGAEKGLDKILAGKIPLVILRPCAMYGPVDRGNYVGLARELAKGRMVVVDGGNYLKNTLQVDSLAGVIRHFLGKPKSPQTRIYNVADPEPLSFRAIISQMAKAQGKSIVFVSVPKNFMLFAGSIGDFLARLSGKRMPISTAMAKAMIGDTVIDTTKLHQELGGVVDFTPFESGIVAYMQQSQ